MVNRLTVKQAAQAAQRAPITIYRALEAGLLHGSQQKAGAMWTIREECLEAWLDGEECAHKQKPQIRHLQLAQ